MKSSSTRILASKRIFSGLPTIIALVALPVLSAQQVIFNGAELTSLFGSAPYTLDATTYSPNSAVAQSARFDFSGDWQHRHFIQSWGYANRNVIPNDINFTTRYLQFDYKTSNTTAVEFRFMIHDGTADQEVLAWRNVPLLTDGQWHTATINYADWTQTYKDLVANEVLNPAVAHTLKIGIRSVAGGSGTTVHIDNITVVPEPASLALFLGAMVAGTCLLRLRRRSEG